VNITNPCTPKEPRWIPEQIREGVFCSKLDENHYAFLELLTPENEKDWSEFRDMNYFIANNDWRGVFSTMFTPSRQAKPTPYDELKEATGFTPEEYEQCKEDVRTAIKNTQGKIVKVICGNSIGSHCMHTLAFRDSEKWKHYIAYITTNKNFSIKDHKWHPKANGLERTLKNYIKAYGDVVISVGTAIGITEEGAHGFLNRGISSNPWLAFLDALHPYRRKWAVLSMILHGFTAAVVAKFFPEKLRLEVRPLGSMQAIICRNLKPGDGYSQPDLLELGDRTDLSTLKVSPDAPECDRNYIKTSALTRIYYSSLAKKTVRELMAAQLLAGARL
jgi:hypothetical protein